MLKDDLKSNPTFKSVIYNLKKKFPFIIGYRLPSNYEENILEFSDVLFIDLVYSVDKLEEYENVKRNEFMESWFNYFDEYKSVKLNSPFQEEDEHQIDFLEEDIEDFIKNTQRSYQDVLRGQDRINRIIKVDNYIAKK